MKLQAKKYLFIVLGIASVILGVIGAFLPILPTAPFAILAAFFFSKASPRLHLWLRGLPRLGPYVVDWEDHHVIRPKSKLLASVLIILSFSASAYFVALKSWWLILHSSIGLALIAFILTRRSYPENEIDAKKNRGGDES